MNTAGLRTDQAPPLSVPLGFYALAPLALVAAGALLAWDGAALLGSSWHPRTMALAHLGTLGLLGAVMFGSLYQMVPVVAGAPVPAIRLAHGVQAALAIGIAGLVAGLATFDRTALWVGGLALVAALLGFLVPVGVALLRAPGRGETVAGMRLAVLALAVLAALGLRLVCGHATGQLPPARGAWLVGHAGVGLVVWVGGLIAAVSWQVVPMFYLAASFPRRVAWSLVAALAATLVLVPVATLAGLPMWAVAAAGLPGALAVWAVQPWQLARLLRVRRRRRRDPTLAFWWLGLALAPAVLLAAVVTGITARPEAALLFGWLAIWGHAGAIVHGMLSRIVPFLVWFHRFAAVAGLADVPPMRQLLPDRQVRVGLWLHGATLVLGSAAILTGYDPLARATGAGLVATGVALGLALAAVPWRARPAVRGTTTGTGTSQP